MNKFLLGLRRFLNPKTPADEIWGKGFMDGGLVWGTPLAAAGLGQTYVAYKLHQLADQNYSIGKQEGYEAGKQEGYESGKREGYEEGYSVRGDEGYEAGYNKGLDAKDISDIYPYLISGGLGAGLGALLSYKRRGLGALIGGAAGGALPLLYEYYKDNYANK